MTRRRDYWKALAEGQDFTRVYLETCAERDALKAELAEAKMLLNHMVNHAEWREKNEGVFWEATEQSRAFLARHQKGADT